MQCLDCRYPLDQLEDRRCPECGREFDPNDQKTFLDANMPAGKALTNRHLKSFVIGLLVALSVGLCAFIVLVSTDSTLIALFLDYWAAPSICIGGLVDRMLPQPTKLIPLYIAFLTYVIIGGAYGFLIGYPKTAKGRWRTVAVIAAFHGLCFLILWYSGAVDL